MAAIDRLYTNHYWEKKDFVIWCIKYNPSLLSSIYHPFDSIESFYKQQQYYAKAKGISLIPENEDLISSMRIAIACLSKREDRYLYWHCPLEFVRDYLQANCGYKKAHWFTKLFWKK